MIYIQVKHWVKKTILSIIIIASTAGFTVLKAEDGYKLWLRYDKVKDTKQLALYRRQFAYWDFNVLSASNRVALSELKTGMGKLLGRPFQAARNIKGSGHLLIGTPQSSAQIKALKLDKQLAKLGSEGFLITKTTALHNDCTVICANTDIGVLYGIFYLLQMIQCEQNTQNVYVLSVPRLKKRVLNHWDNLDGTIERGYAGKSIWKWDELPGKIDQRYIDYARANASVGINGVVLNNVNANPLILTKPYLEKVKALADIFRPYGIQVYLSAFFASPITIGKLTTADPLNPSVKNWWANKVNELYALIPDFGGFCVKANSEGQPGPQDYNRNHADGANMLADVLEPHKGIVMWRAFVYGNKDADRAKQAYQEFKGLDGAFHKNVLLQVKNGPMDFQPREPFHPLFGAMPHTQLMLEFQITQEYLGFATYLVYLAPLFSECLQADTYDKGKGSTISQIITHNISPDQITGIAGVANIGDAVNWCGHPFAQANWYAFGKLAWNPDATPAAIARNWIKLTFGNNTALIKPLQDIMLESRDIAVNFMEPMGLNTLMDGTHFRPAPWRYDKSRAGKGSWHHADASGIGFDRTETGSNALEQYAAPVRNLLNDTSTCPDNLLLWFHHIRWDARMKSGKTLWAELCTHYQAGVNGVRKMQQSWQSVKEHIDNERFQMVSNLLEKQEQEAVIWHDACLLYFQQYSNMPFPAGTEQPAHNLNYYKQLPLPK